MQLKELFWRATLFPRHREAIHPLVPMMYLRCDTICHSVCLLLLSAHLLLTKFEGDSGKKPHVSIVVLPRVSFSFSPSVSPPSPHLSSSPPSVFLSFTFTFSISVPLCLPLVQFHSLTSQLKRTAISINCSNCVSPHRSPN